MFWNLETKFVWQPWLYLTAQKEVLGENLKIYKVIEFLKLS